MTTGIAHTAGTWPEQIWSPIVSEDRTAETAVEPALIESPERDEPVMNLAAEEWWPRYVRSRLMQFASR